MSKAFELLKAVEASKDTPISANLCREVIGENLRLREALQELYDDCADYIKLNNFYRSDSQSAIWNQTMVDAKAALTS